MFYEMKSVYKMKIHEGWSWYRFSPDKMFIDNIFVTCFVIQLWKKEDDYIIGLLLINKQTKVNKLIRESCYFL